MAKEFQRGREYQLGFNGGVLVSRYLQFGEHPLAPEARFRASLDVQKKMVQNGASGVIDIQTPKRGTDRNPYYPISGFDSDLFQSAREQRLTGPELSNIMAGVVDILTEVGSLSHRTHGRLRPQSILFKRPARGPGNIALTDFEPNPAAVGLPPACGRPWVFEPEDLKAFGHLIIRLVTAKLDAKAKDISWNDLPDETDARARQCFDRQWPEWHRLAKDLLALDTPIKTLENLRARLPGQNRPPPPRLPPKPKSKQTITFDPLSIHPTVGDTFILSAKATSGLPVHFSVDGPAQLTGAKLQLNASGTVTIRASQAGNNEYEPAAEVTQSFAVKESQTIYFDPPTAPVFGSGPHRIDVTVSSGLPVEISPISGPVEVSGYVVTPTGAGVIQLKATQPGNDEFHPVEKVLAFTVVKAPQSITFPPLNDKLQDDPAFEIQAETSSPLPVTFEVEDGPARIVGHTLSLRGPGKVTVRASQRGDDNYEAAADVAQSFEVRERIAQVHQTITFAPLGDKSFGCPPFAIHATASSDLPVELRVVSGPATLQDRQVALTGAGLVKIKATQAGDPTYQAAEATLVIDVAPAAQTIEFDPTGDQIFGVAPFRLKARSSAALPVSFAAVSGPAKNSGDMVTLLGAGVVRITATHPGNKNHLPAEAQQIFTVAPADQAITFAPLPREIPFGDTLSLRAEASSGLPVAFTVVSGSGTIAANQLSLNDVGVIKIQASQKGNSNCRPAPDIIQTLTVIKARQTITFDGWPGEIFVGDSFLPQAAASSKLRVVLEVVGAGPAQLKEGRLTGTGVGSANIKATQAGDHRFEPAEALHSFLIVKRPQHIHLDELEHRHVDDPAFLVHASADSRLDVFLEVSGPATLDGNEVTVTGPGTVEIQATQAGDSAHASAEKITRFFQVIQRRQRIQFEELEDQKVGDPSFQLQARSDSRLPVEFDVLSGPATLDGDEITVTGGGEVTIRASQAGNHVYEPADDVTQSFAVKNPKRARMLIYATLAAAFAIGMIVVAAVVLGRKGSSDRALAEVRQLIREDKPGKALLALEKADLPDDRKSALAQALRTAPALREPPPRLEMRPGDSPTTHLALTLPSDLPEADMLRQHLRWEVRVAQPKIGDVTLTPSPTNWVATQDVVLTAAAAKNASNATNSFVLVLSNSVTNASFSITVVVQSPVMPTRKLGDPRIMPPGRIFTNEVAVRIEPDSAGDPIYYTLNGGEPTTNTLRYTNLVRLTNTTLVKAKAIRNGTTPSATVSNLFTVNPTPTLKMPTITPKGESFRNEVMVTLTPASAGDPIYYTKDGREPTTGAPLYTNRFQLTNTTLVKAKAIRSGSHPSVTASNLFTVVSTPTLEVPAITPNGGSYQDAVPVTLTSAEPGAKICYTLDGGEPTSISPSYSRPITLTKSAIVKAKAFKPGSHPSATVSNRFTVTPTPSLAAPVITPNGGSHQDAVRVTLTSAESGTKIYFTLDSSEPTESSPPYSGPMTLTNTATVQARAFKPGFNPSPSASASFTVTTTPTLAAPVITPASGSYLDWVEVKVTHPTSGVRIHFTENGAEPTTNSSLYLAPFKLTDKATLKAKAFKSGSHPGATAGATFTVTRTPKVVPMVTTPPPKDDLSELTNELEAFKVWLHLQNNDKSPSILNPKGYEALGVKPGDRAEWLHLNFNDYPTRQSWNKRLLNLEKRITGTPALSSANIKGVLKDLKMIAKGTIDQ